MFYLKGAADTDLQPVVNMGEVGLTVAQTSNFSREAKVRVIFFKIINLLIFKMLVNVEKIIQNLEMRQKDDCSPFQWHPRAMVLRMGSLINSISIT